MGMKLAPNDAARIKAPTGKIRTAEQGHDLINTIVLAIADRAGPGVPLNSKDIKDFVATVPPNKLDPGHKFLTKVLQNVLKLAANTFKDQNKGHDPLDYQLRQVATLLPRADLASLAAKYRTNTSAGVTEYTIETM